MLSENPDLNELLRTASNKVVPEPKTIQEAITQSFEQRVRRLRGYKAAIDEVFGSGYAANNPGLIGAMWQAEEIEDHGEQFSQGLSIWLSK